MSEWVGYQALDPVLEQTPTYVGPETAPAPSIPIYNLTGSAACYVCAKLTDTKILRERRRGKFYYLPLHHVCDDWLTSQS